MHIQLWLRLTLRNSLVVADASSGLVKGPTTIKMTTVEWVSESDEEEPE